VYSIEDRRLDDVSWQPPVQPLTPHSALTCHACQMIGPANFRAPLSEPTATTRLSTRQKNLDLKEGLTDGLKNALTRGLGPSLESVVYNQRNRHNSIELEIIHTRTICKLRMQNEQP